MTYGPSPKVSALLFLILGVAIAFFIWRNDQRIYANEGRLGVKVSERTLELSWRGVVEVPMARRFEEAFNEWASQTDTIVIDLKSPGGALSEGAQVINLIEQMKRTHTIETHVGRFAECLSMCVPIYLRGDRRRAARSSRWMFHEPRSVNAITGEEEKAPDFERRFEGKKFFNRYFVNSPMDPVWRDTLEKEWVGKDVWKSGRDLMDEGSGIIIDVY